MSNPIDALVRSWGDDVLSVTRLRIQTLEKWLYNSYEPNKFGEADFEQRLIDWLSNVPADADKRLLLRLLVELFYVGPVEFEELYRSAYQGPIARWLIDCESIDACSPDAERLLGAAARDTWFCPVTDSFRINAFFHINNLMSGGSLRPDWRSLMVLGDPEKIRQHCTVPPGVKRLVLLEDFVGGGSQSLAAVNFAAQTVPGLQILFVPLIVCPEGAIKARTLVLNVNAMSPNLLQFEPVVELPEDAFLTRALTPFPSGDGYTDKLRELIHRTYPQVSGAAPLGQKPYDPYGFPALAPTGGIVVMFSNTPDNTLPIVHCRPAAKTWQPIFPRHSRD